MVTVSQVPRRCFGLPDQDWTRVRPIKIEPKIIEEILKLAK